MVCTSVVMCVCCVRAWMSGVVWSVVLSCGALRACAGGLGEGVRELHMVFTCLGGFAGLRVPVAPPYLTPLDPAGLDLYH